MNSSGGGRPNHDLRAIAGTLVGLGVVAFVFAYVLPRIADYREVWAVVQSLSWWWILALVAASACFVLSDGLPWIVVLPRLGFLNALRMDLAGSALSQVLPGGAAVNAATQFGMLKRWGYEGRPVVLAVSLTSIWNQIAVYAFPVLALVWLSLEGGSDRRLNTVALTALAVLVVIVAGLAVVLSSDRLARSTGDRLAKAATWLRRRIHKSPVGWGGESFVRFRHEANDLLRHRWPALTVATLVNRSLSSSCSCWHCAPRGSGNPRSASRRPSRPGRSSARSVRSRSLRAGWGSWRSRSAAPSSASEPVTHRPWRPRSSTAS
jgi:uncharacterized membrane protein YbhN (UPF0104 family)